MSIILLLSTTTRITDGDVVYSSASGACGFFSVGDLNVQNRQSYIVLYRRNNIMLDDHIVNSKHSGERSGFGQFVYT